MIVRRDHLDTGSIQLSRFVAHYHDAGFQPDCDRLSQAECLHRIGSAWPTSLPQQRSVSTKYSK